jgi:hypothetical protein
METQVINSAGKNFAPDVSLRQTNFLTFIVSAFAGLADIEFYLSIQKCKQQAL